MSHVIRREWKCDKCGKNWINEITLKAVESQGPEKADALIACPNPDCGKNYFVMGEPGHEIAGVTTHPKGQAG